MTFTRRHFLQTTTASSFLGLLMACSPSNPLKIASHVWPGYEFMFLAQNEGWLNSRQVELIQTTSANLTLNSLMEGRVDGGALTLDEVLRARSQGLDLAVVLVFDISAGADVLLGQAGIKQPSELRGKRVGYEEGTVTSLMLRQALHVAGLTLADIHAHALPADQQLAAWNDRRIDALVTFEPTASQLMASGANRLFDSRQLPNLIIDVLAIRHDVLKSKAKDEAIRHLLSAHFRALRHLSTNPHDAFFRMSSRLGLPPERVPITYRGLLLPDAQNNLRLMIGSGHGEPVLVDSAKRLSSLMTSIGLIPSGNTLEGLFQEEYLSLEGDAP